MMSPVYIAVVCFALATLTVGAPNVNFLNLKADLENLEKDLTSSDTQVPSKIVGSHSNGLNNIAATTDDSKHNEPSANGAKKPGLETDLSKDKVSSPKDAKKSDEPKEKETSKTDEPKEKETPTKDVKKTEEPKEKETSTTDKKKTDETKEKETSTTDKKKTDEPETIIYNFGTFSSYLKEIVTENKADTPGKVSADPNTFTADVKCSGTVNVTYVKIEVKQIGKVGSAYVTKGAIGTPSIEIHLEAKNTFTYTTKCYSSSIVVKTASIGKHTPKDVILERVASTQQYAGVTNATVVVKYPNSSQHKGKKVTYVSVTSKQTSDKLSVNVTQGVLAKTTDNLEITLIANDTKLVSYEVVFYSSAARSQPFIFTAAVALMAFLWNRVAKI